MTKFSVIVAIVFFSIGSIWAQTPQLSQPQIWGDPDGLTGRDCETTMMLIDFVAVAGNDAAKDQPIIILARSGRGETSRRLTLRRLKQVSDYLARRVARERIVAAEGAPSNGLGQVEFYVAGRLHTVIKIKRNRDLVSGCGAE